MAQPVISYPGAKWRFYPYIKGYFPTDMKLFIEPFFGGGSVSLSVADDPDFSKLERIIGGDLAPEIWAFWEGCKKYSADVVAIAENWMRSSCPHKIEFEKYGTLAEVKEQLGMVQILEDNAVDYTEEQPELVEFMDMYKMAISECRAFWDWTQTVDCSQLSIPQRAARTYLVNKMSFSGMGDSGTLSAENCLKFRLYKLNRILEASKTLSKIEIYNVSFEETMKYAKENPKDTFVFLDPPYYKQEGSGLYGRNGDTHHGFPHEQFALETRNLPCKWFVTYDDSVKVRRMFMGKTVNGERIHITPFKLPGGYKMALHNSEDALAGEEVFISNYPLNSEDEQDILSSL